MTTDNKPAPAAPAAEGAAKTFVAFFTPKDAKGTQVELFKTLSDKERAPLFDGKIGDEHVSAFLRTGPKGNFLGLVGAKDEATGLSKDIGTANVRIRESGVPVLVIDMKKPDGTKEALFVSISKKVDNDMLVHLGMDVAKRDEKLAAVAAKAVAEADAPAKKPAPAPKP